MSSAVTHARTLQQSTHRQIDRQPLPLRVCFRPEYVAEAREHSMRKLGWIADELRRRSDFELVEPAVLDPQSLRTLHDPVYVDAFLSNRRPLASSQNLGWSPGLRSAVLAALGGQLAAARFALEHGVAANLAQGFHHARYARGGGFCTFNGLALVAAENPELKVAVLDCDEHAGNGTAEFTERLSNLHSVSIHGIEDRFGCAEGPRSLALPLHRLQGDYRPYANALARAFEFLEQVQPDLVIYQAGVDCHEKDPLGSLALTDADLRSRDAAVFSWARTRDTPIFFVMAGGYMARDELTRLHLQTFDTCLEVFQPALQPRPDL